MLRLMQPVQTGNKLESILSPTLILVGDREMPAFKACAETLRQKLPRNTFNILPNTDHLCLLQVPQLAAQHISSHLTANRQ